MDSEPFRGGRMKVNNMFDEWWFTVKVLIVCACACARVCVWIWREEKATGQVERGFICILHCWHSNCHPTLLFLFVFYYSLARSHISHIIHHAAGHDCGLTLLFNGPIIPPLCHSLLLSLLGTLSLSLLPPNLCRQPSDLWKICSMASHHSFCQS